VAELKGFETMKKTNIKKRPATKKSVRKRKAALTPEFTQEQLQAAFLRSVQSMPMEIKQRRDELEKTIAFMEMPLGAYEDMLADGYAEAEREAVLELIVDAAAHMGVALRALEDAAAAAKEHGIAYARDRFAV